MRLTILWKVINEWDPMRLLEDGSIDEYKYEINRIYSLFGEVDNVDRLSNGIYNIFIRNYGVDRFKRSIQECQRVAEVILNDGHLPQNYHNEIFESQYVR